ncbi:S-layer homology domain-containing protein [Candidatus Gracilibacteria bacterium]|nr:S-layer homology domain-containing protein [Candidatus Gracilibacteria bacterium]
MKNKLTTSFFLFSFLFSLFSFPSFAAPTILSERDQTFEQNDPPTQLRDITITEDSSTPYITEGSIKIKIPTLLPIIFDDERTLEGVAAYGSAVDNGKVDEIPAITFEDRDKTLVISINATFAPGEQLNLTKIFVEGFNQQPASSDKLTLHINDNEEYFSDTRHLYVRTSSTDDTRAPEAPTNIQVTDHESGVKITWSDPTDLDVQLIQILRGKNSVPVDGTPFIEIGNGIEEYIDTALTEGDTVKYILRATDGLNTSGNSNEVTFVVGSTETEEENPAPPVEEEAPAPIPDEQIICTELYAPICGLDNKTYSNACKAGLVNVEVAYQGECQISKPVPSDIADHWSKDYSLALFNRGIIKGYPDNTFQPDSNLNRAEAAALLYRAIYNSDSPTTPSEKPFSDVPTDQWYSAYIADLKNLGIIKGNPDNTFQPDETINRAEFLTLALDAYYYWTTDERKLQVDNFKGSPKTETYSDLEDTWYTSTVSAATALNFIEGQACGDKKCFNASASITRAESAKILFEMFFK